MSSTVFPNKAEHFYSSGEHYLGNNPIFNPFFGVKRLSREQKLYKLHPLLNYGMSYPGNLPPEGQPMTPNERFASQVRLLINTVHQLGDVQNGHLLEVGAGTGSGAYIVNNVFKPASLEGVDFSLDQVGRAKKINEDNSRIHFHHLNAGDIATQFGEGQFDGIYSVEMVQHLDETTLQKFVEGAFTTLKSDKRLSFCSFFSESEKGQAHLRKVFPTVDLGLDYMHNIDRVKLMIEQSGFKDVRTMSIGKYVWEQLVRWCNQIAPTQTWSNAYLKVFPKLLDYYIVTGTKK